MIFSIYTINVFKDHSLEAFSDEGSGSIAVIEIDGVIMDSKKVVENLFIAENDRSIKAIILRIDSPGGAVGPTQEIYQEVRRIDGLYDADPKKGKPIYASFGSIAASGGYYIGAAARRIYSNPGTLTGSIGVIMQFADLSKLFEFAKINPEIIKAGKYKDIGQPSRGLTQEERTLMNGMMDGVHQQFIRDIMLLRSAKIKGDIKQIAQGQVFTGEEAMQLGLVDSMGSLWQAGRKIHEELHLKGEFGMRFIKKKKKTSILDFFENIEEGATNLKDKVTARSGLSPLMMFMYSGA
jgi:protease-4